MENKLHILKNNIETKDLSLSWCETPWDSNIFGARVLQINKLHVVGEFAEKSMEIFLRDIEKSKVALVSARISHEKLRESMLLEDFGFKFIEMVYQPVLEDIQSISGNFEDSGLLVSPASNEDMNLILDIATISFSNERFRLDHRVDNNIGDQRYRNWVLSTKSHISQKLYAVKDGKTLVAFFIVEYLNDGTCYWHLNAVSPELQGKGYGRKSWLAMIHHARKHGATKIKTCIAARNIRVLNLYARLNFVFQSPQMTFHWVRELN